MTFISDDNYLGKAWKKENGELRLYPFWIDILKQLFPNNLDTNYSMLLETGARGIGKSEIACGVIAPYLLHRILCMKDPAKFYDIKSTEKITFAFMNIKLELTEEIALDKFQKNIQLSPWFMSKGKLTSYKNSPYWIPPEPLELVIGSQADDVVGRPIFFAFFDEISFIRNQDIDKQKQKAKDMVDTARGGMVTRFIRNGKNPTLMCIGSSKRSEQSFMESYIKTIISLEDDSALIVDKPVWEVKPKGTYGEGIFYVGLGNKYLSSVVIPDNADLTAYKEKGYKILEVPKFFKKAFLEDLDRQLCDIAGVSVSSTNKYMSPEAVMECINQDFKNPFPDILTIGNAKDDLQQYYNFFDLNNIPSELKRQPLFIHLDMSISGDMTGIAGVWIVGKKPSTDENQAKDLMFRVAFSTSIEAPKGHQISFEKNRNFIRWLKGQGFNIKEITSDTFQSYDLQQQLTAEGFTCSILSVDRVQDGICKPYQYLKSAVYEKRLQMFKSERLFDEFIDVERNINTGKVDHTPNCFTGDTKIRLVDGRSLSILELLDEYVNGKINYVYSMNELTHKVEPKKILNVWCSGQSTILYQLTLDNGEIIKCTPEHLFMIRNGSYVPAKDLIIGDSLMPLYTKVAEKGLKGYRLYYEPFEDKWHYEHRSFASEILDEKYLVHHKDCNKLNNNPSNLIWMSKNKHNEIHSKANSGAYSGEAQLKRSNSVKKWHEENKYSLSYLERNKKLSTINKEYQLGKRNGKLTKAELKKRNTLNRIKKYFKDIDVDNLTSSQIRSLSTKIQHIEGKHLDYSNAHKKSKIALKKSNNKISNLKKLFPVVNKEEFYNMFNFSYDSIEPSKRAQWVNRYRSKKYDLLNHKIIDIQILNVDNINVYDLEVEDNHNFALDCGIFVHNSHKDALDAVCGATFTASKYAEEFAYDFGEAYEIMDKLNTQADSDLKTQMTLDFEQELLKANSFAKSIQEEIKKDNDKNNNLATLMGYDDGLFII